MLATKALACRRLAAKLHPDLARSRSGSAGVGAYASGMRAAAFLLRVFLTRSCWADQEKFSSQNLLHVGMAKRK
eukprot:3940773-Rhodomonas_salina.2